MQKAESCRRFDSVPSHHSELQVQQGVGRGTSEIFNESAVKCLAEQLLLHHSRTFRRQLSHCSLKLGCWTGSRYKPERRPDETALILFRRAGIFNSEDSVTRKQESLRTRDEAEARTLLHARNEAARQSAKASLETLKTTE